MTTKNKPDNELLENLQPLADLLWLKYAEGLPVERNHWNNPDLKDAFVAGHIKGQKIILPEPSGRTSHFLDVTVEINTKAESTWRKYCKGLPLDFDTWNNEDLREAFRKGLALGMGVL